MAWSPDMALAASLNVGVARKMWLVDLRLGIGGERVCDEMAQTRVDDKDGRVGSQKEVNVGAVGLERRLGPHDNGKDDGGLEGWSETGSIEESYHTRGLIPWSARSPWSST